jgi:hypothetical protein
MPAAIRPWTPQYNGLQGDKVTPRDSKETARIAENSQLAGHFSRVWQVWVQTNVGWADGLADRSLHPSPMPMTCGYA